MTFIYPGILAPNTGPSRESFRRVGPHLTKNQQPLRFARRRIFQELGQTYASDAREEPGVVILASFKSNYLKL